MSIPTGFEEQLATYCTQAQEARREGQHHDQRRELFLSFITKAFGIDPADISREEFVSLVHRHGWVDALFRDLVFEFKRDLKKEHKEGLRELRDYLGNLPDGPEYVGLLTDGLQFEVYVLAGDGLRQTDAIDLATADAEIAFMWLDSYLFSQKGVPPTSADLVRRFGAKSPTFLGAARVLGGLLTELGDSPGVQIKKQQWRVLLTRVYGSDVTSNDLFVRHTYLAQFAKLLAYAARNGALYDTDTLEQIVDGGVFHRLGIGNIGEADFFAWILEPDARRAALSVMSGLAASLAVYDLSRINEDLFKQLYQNLVDPETRHDLGEYYTPDWLAELTLEEIDYRPGQSLLDPACGSGTFLFSALKRLEAKGLTGWDLINFALENVVGMDIHPLATTIARINYFLAIQPHMDALGGPMRDGELFVGLLNMPVYNADALTIIDKLVTKDDTRYSSKRRTLESPVMIVPVDGSEEFRVPVEAARDPDGLVDLINNMDSYARDLLRNPELEDSASGFDALVAERFPSRPFDPTQTIWRNNLRLLHRLIAEQRNGIWAYVLKSRSRPLMFALRKFDVITGNPPWLSYRFIKDTGYQRDVKELTMQHGLLQKGEVKLFTQMDLSTLFFVFCEEKYLVEGGALAFVMPRSVLTGAKQHRAFQQRGLTRVVDLKDAAPLFNVEACVAIRQAGQIVTENVPSVSYAGRLPRHEMALEEARPLLTRQEGAFSALKEIEVQSPHYYEQFKQGATLVPRNLIFARPQQIPPPGGRAFNPMLATDPDVDRHAKAPWKGIRMRGYVEPPFWFATLLSKHLVPFGVRQFSLVVLPLEALEDGSLTRLTDKMISERALVRTRQEWLRPADEKWEELKKETTEEGLWEWLNYHNKLTSQQVRGVFKVIYNTSGTHIAATVVDTHGESPQTYRYPTQGLVTEMTTYSSDFSSAEEAHYLAAMLNAPCINQAIKKYQPRGLYGARHITRRPFEYCVIPVFDPDDADHLALARLSQEAHAVVGALDLTEMGVVKARKLAREAVQAQIARIDTIARRLLGM